MRPPPSSPPQGNLNSIQKKIIGVKTYGFTEEISNQLEGLIMNKDLTAQMYGKYPKIFKDKDAPMTQSLVCFGFEFGDGWHGLIDDACAKLQLIADLGGDQIVATQMKEKFAGLRFYVQHTPPEDVAPVLPEEQRALLSDIIDDVISRAESKSYHTCEDCGEYLNETFIHHGWHYALCSEHVADMLLNQMLGKWPSDSKDTTRAQKLELIKAKGLMWNDCHDILAWARKHVTEEGIKEMMYLSTYIVGGATQAELELIWLWYIADQCGYTLKTLHLVGVPERLIDELDAVQSREKAQWLYPSDEPTVARVVIAIMRWYTAKVEKRYNEEREKHDSSSGSGGDSAGDGGAGTPAGAGVSEADGTPEVDGVSKGTGDSVGSGELDTDSGEAAKGALGPDQSQG
jgi:hypothetical protein